MGNARRLPQSRGPGFFLVASPHVNRRANLILGGHSRLVLRVASVNHVARGRFVRT